MSRVRSVEKLIPLNMRLITFRLLVSLCALLAVVESAPHAAAAPPPFIERVRPADYVQAEKAFPQAFSKTSELVILRTTAAKPVSVLAIAHAASGDGYTLTVELASEGAPDGWLKISDELDATLGRQVLRAVELKLHRQVALSDFKRTMSKTDTDVWVYQNTSDGRMAAALLSPEATFNNPAAASFLNEFIGSLERVVGKEGEERSALLQKIDRAATEIILSETRSNH